MPVSVSSVYAGSTPTPEPATFTLLGLAIGTYSDRKTKAIHQSSVNLAAPVLVGNHCGRNFY
jgi:hypothetical protein